MFCLKQLVRNKNIFLVDDLPLYCDPGVGFEHFINRMGKYEIFKVPEQISLKDREPLSNIFKSIARKKGIH